MNSRQASTYDCIEELVKLLAINSLTTRCKTTIAASASSSTHHFVHPPPTPAHRPNHLFPLHTATTLTMQRLSPSAFRLLSATKGLKAPLQITTSSSSVRPFSSSAPTNKPQHHSHCVDVVKSSSPSSFHLGLLLSSPKIKRSYFAIKAFENQIAAIKLNQRDLNESMPSQIKFQWWRDRIEDLYEDRLDVPEIASNPIAAELGWAVKGEILQLDSAS
jgi:hypothetical protein